MLRPASGVLIFFAFAASFGWAESPPSQADRAREAALACARQKDWGCAVRNYRAALNAEPDADTRYNLALALKYSGDAGGAAAEFERVLKDKPNWAEAEYGLGACLYDLHKDTLAIAALRRAIAQTRSFSPLGCSWRTY